MLLSDGVEGRVRLPAAEAIASFVSWLQRRGDTGLTRSKRLIALYSIHCDELSLAELSSNIMLQELRKVAPRSEERVPRTDRYRQRASAYCIPHEPLATNLQVVRSAA